MQPGDALDSRTFGPVESEKMKTLAAILRDPNVIHIDRDLVQSRGLGDRLINQGPINLGYVTNMLEAAFGPGSIERLTVRFGANVFEDDVVTAGGTVTEVSDGEITCDIWLERQDGTRAVEGTAIVRV
jgi:acyl dehydratase